MLKLRLLDGAEEQLDDDDDERDTSTEHFGPNSAVLTEDSRKTVDAGLWKTSNARSASLGGSRTVQYETGTESNAYESLSIQRRVSASQTVLSRQLVTPVQLCSSLPS